MTTEAPTQLNAGALAELLAGRALPPESLVDGAVLLPDQLRQLGLHVRGAGWCLDPAVERLDAVALQGALTVRARTLWPQVTLWPQIGSTNTELLALDGAAAGQVYATEYQWGGRGRRGRAWLSPIARNVAVSAAWCPPLAIAELAGLSLVVGLAVADALQTLGVPGVQLKWPNDVVVSNAAGLAKLAGILVELQVLPAGSLVVIGVGVNFNSASLMRERVPQPIADIAEHAPLVRRLDVLAALLNALADYLQAFAATGFEPMRRAWEQLHAYQGQVVELHGAGPQAEPWRGTVLGVTATGELRLHTQGGERSFNAGEVSLRAAAEAARP